MSSPKAKAFPRSLSSSNGKTKKWAPYLESIKTDSATLATPRTTKPKQPFIQDTLDRITSPYKHNRKFVEFSPQISSAKWPNSATTPKRQRPTTAKFEPVDSSPLFHATDSMGFFPSQGATEANLKDSLVTLKTVLREYEEKQKEKRAMQKVVDELKAQVEGMKGRKVNFTKNFEKLHKDRLLMGDSAASKENQRVLISKNVTQARDAVSSYDNEIQDAIVQNVEVAKMIREEQNIILAIKQEMAEMKKIFPLVTKEKEKARNDIQISSKKLKNMEEKYVSLVKEKATYLQHIDNSKIIKS